MKRNFFRMFAVVGILGLYAACSDNSTVAPKPGLSPRTPSFDFSTPANGSGACMGNDAVTADGLVSNWVSGNPAPADFNCTSNDISIATTTIVGYSFVSSTGPFTPLPAGQRITCTPGQTIFAQTTAQLQNNAQDRYNIGIWIANDPTLGVQGSATDGTCFHYNLIPGVNGSTQKDGDFCGDMNQGTGLASVDLGALTIECPAGQATVSVNNCIGWENSNLVSARGSCPNTDPANSGTPQISTTQGFRDGTLPETKAKCNCTPFLLPIDVRGKITIVKNTVGGDGTFAFTSDVDTNSSPIVTSPFNITTSSLTGSQLITNVRSGTYHIAESTPPSDFTFTSLSCTANNAFASATTSSQTATITMGNGGDITCTFTNTKKTFLTLVKTVTNDQGGTKTLSDFPLTATGPVTISGVSGTTNVTSRVVSAGTYALTEQTQAGYAASSWSCSGGTQSGASVTLATGNNATCTINNNDIGATLTLVKVVTNNSGGTKTLSDFPLTAAGPVTISGTSGTSAVTGASVNAGTYALSEQTQTGYTASTWSCSGGTQSGANITLALGGAATCTISNNDIAPKLIIKKTVIGAGATFGFTATSNGSFITSPFSLSPPSNSSDSVVYTTTAMAGAFSVTEGTMAGYVLTDLGCSDQPVGTYNPTSTRTVIDTLSLGETVTCTFINQQQVSQTTRTQGFWATHDSLTNAVWFGGTVGGNTFPGVSDQTLCGRSLNTLPIVLGGFWSNIAKTTDGTKRSSLDQARMQLLQQLLAAILNNAAFGSSPTAMSIADAKAAYCGTDQTLIQQALNAMASFNSSGDNGTFTPGISANGKRSKTEANLTFWDILP